MKKNLKHYNVGRNTLLTVFNQLRQFIPKRDNSDRKDIVDVCQDLIEHSDPYIQYWFMYYWLRIIHETGEYFNSMSKKHQGYYREAFIEKLEKKFWYRFMEKFSDVDLVPTSTITHLQNLFHTYIEQKIYHHKKK